MSSLIKGSLLASFLEEEVLYLLASFSADIGLANRFHVAFYSAMDQK